MLNNNKQTKIAVLLKMTIASSVITPYATQALTIIDDTNIGSYTSTGVSASSDDFTIQTSATTSAPQINKTTGGDGLLAEYGKKIIIDSVNKFVIKNIATGNYNSANGIRVANGEINAKNEIDINMKDGAGIYFASGGKGTFDQKVTINSTGTSANSFIGIRGYSDSTSVKTTGEFNGQVEINSTGNGSYGIMIQNNNNLNALGTNIIFNDKAIINMTGNDTIGISMMGTISTNANSALFFNNGLDITTLHGATISTNQSGGTITIKAGDNQNNIVSTDNLSYNAIEAISGTINVEGKTNLEGDIIAVSDTAQGIVNLKFHDGSTLISSMDNGSVNNSYGTGKINLEMSGSNSQWKMINNSYIDSLALNNEAKVSFGYDYATPNMVTTFNDTNKMTLTTNTLSGSGLFEMRTAIGSELSADLLKVTGTSQATGNHKIAINDSGTGSAIVTGNEQITLVQTEGGSANFTLNSPAVDVGQYKFNQLKKIKDERDTGTIDWVLISSTEPEPEPEPEFTDTAKNAANILNSSYLMNYVETQTLLQRMGQLRQTESSDGDVWGRIYSGKLSSFNDKRLSNFDMDYYGLQIGVDRKIDVEQGDIYYGIMGGMSRGNVDYSVGDGNTKSYYASLYGMFQSGTGFYIDGLFKYMRMNNKFNTRTSAGYAVKGDGNTTGFSAGIELGQRFYLSSTLQNNEGWYLEPQGQLTYSHQGGTTINATNGLRTKLDSYNSLLGRVSIIAGYTIVNSENPVDIYFKTGYVKEFDGDTAYTFNHSAKEKYDFGGSWWDNGIGINMQLNKQHNIYTDIAYSLGNKFDQKQINVGYRYSF